MPVPWGARTEGQIQAHEAWIGKAAPSRGNRGRSAKRVLTGPAANARELLEGKERRGAASREDVNTCTHTPTATTHPEEVDACSWLQPGL